MRPTILLGLVLAGATAACATAASEPSPAARAATGPIVLELFTSQGCSSCPPADRLLSRWIGAGRIGDRAVVPLSFHVDYWDDLGWADPWAQPAWSERQRAYARGDDGRVYTPQLVVGGREDVVGSNAAGVHRLVAAAPAPALLAAEATWKPAALDVVVTAPAAADVWLAVYEDGLRAEVTRGENAGQELRGEHVVRRLERVTTAGQRGALTVALDPRWRHLGAVLFAQATDRTVVASRALAPRPAP